MNTLVSLLFILPTLLVLHLQSEENTNSISPLNDSSCTYHPPSIEFPFHPATAIKECKGNIWNEDFSDLSSWYPRTTKPFYYFEGCAFDPDNVSTKKGTLKVKAYSTFKKKGNSWDHYFGGQVTTKQKFSPAQNATFSCIMKPSGEWGIVNAFFMHDLDDDSLRSTDRCYENNHEIDIEIIRYDEKHLQCNFTTWKRAYQYLPGEDAPEYMSQKYDRINCSSYVLLPLSYSNEFHKYGFKWSEEKIEFFIDDQMVSVHSKNDPVLNVIPTHTTSLKINTWIGDWANAGKPVPDGTLGICEVKSVCVNLE